MDISFNILIFRRIKAYLKSSSLGKAALMVHCFMQLFHIVVLNADPTSYTLSSSVQEISYTDELLYLKAQFAPNINGLITLDNFRSVYAPSFSHSLW
ncbi:unnamed protein product [Eruca vesicaria subsp. sativa]|uniref:Uncharacterized protein n=1 Tax=Eruca vesicaria subsp. sativa TaxID=29727 RepID=A0ABC8LS84_ERUVS|nr:unnamed protein product [Eruca vesicaria subsp. sativa]